MKSYVSIPIFIAVLHSTVEIQWWKVAHACRHVNLGYTSLDLSVGIVVLIMAESSLNTEIKPYQFKPTDVSGYSDNDDDSSQSETDIREQASFTERLGTMDWCECAKCSPMPSGIECQCCREMEGIDEQLTEHGGGL